LGRTVARSLARALDRRFWNQICRVLDLTPSCLPSVSRVEASGFLHRERACEGCSDCQSTYLFSLYVLTSASSCAFVGLNLGSFFSPTPASSNVDWLSCVIRPSWTSGANTGFG
jgi:hypothetical protein